MDEPFGISWSRSAFRDLDEILEFLAAEASVGRAVAVYEDLRRKIDSLKSHPRRCRRVPEFRGLGLEEHRELIVPPYRIFFRLHDSRLVLLGILDSRRDLEELIVQRALEP